jgi:2-oxoglutarate ferredoxin oxidoreductase subunit alpha
VRGLPLHPQVREFIARHQRVYVVEQNRDGQLEGLLRQELPGKLGDRLRSVRHYNGVPIDAAAITDPVITLERPAGKAAAAHGGRSAHAASVTGGE